MEVALCGHATLASAFVIARHIDPGMEKVVFQSASGPLTVTRVGEVFTLDFPSDPPAPLADDLVDGRGAVGHAPGAGPQGVLKPDGHGGLILGPRQSEARARAAETAHRRRRGLGRDTRRP